MPETVPPSLLNDPALAEMVRPAVDPEQARIVLSAHLGQRIVVDAIRVIRHKAGRRCLIQYNLRADETHNKDRVVLIGKMRRKGADKHTFELHQFLREHGFGDASETGVSVPEPVALVPEWGMWLQRQVTGVPVTQLLHQPDGPAVCRRIALALRQLHLTPAPTRRQHSVADEMAILHERFDRLIERNSQWTERLQCILGACDRIEEQLAKQPNPSCGIHRDFYPDQVLLDGRRVWLLDLDLFACGDPALDVGNFIGHLTELGLRRFGSDNALACCETAMVDQYLQENPQISRASIAGYRALTLARHVSLTQQLPSRAHFTGRLLSLWESMYGQPKTA